MKKEYNRSISTKVGDIVNLRVYHTDRNNTINSGVIGIVVKVSSTGPGSAVVLTQLGIFGRRRNNEFMISPMQYTVIKAPTLSARMSKLRRREIRNGVFDKSSYNVVSMRKAFEIEHNLQGVQKDRVGTRKCNCSRRVKRKSCEHTKLVVCDPKNVDLSKRIYCALLYVHVHIIVKIRDNH